MGTRTLFCDNGDTHHENTGTDTFGHQYFSSFLLLDNHRMSLMYGLASATPTF